MSEKAVLSENVVDSPVDWVAEHIHRYVESGGTEGHLWRGVPTLLLTTTGRRTGRRHRTALIYGRDGADYVVVASKGGADSAPQWYLNLSADPGVEVQAGTQVVAATARTATPAEKARLWPAMAAIWPDYDAYQQKTSRDIPVVILTPSTPAG